MQVDNVAQYVPAQKGMLPFTTSLSLLLPSKHLEQPEKLGHRPGTFLYVVYIY